MITNRTRDRYHPLSMAVHWLTLGLLIAVYALIELRGIYPKGSAAHDAMKTWHFMLGLTVFVIVLLRVVLRLVFSTPPIVPPLPVWQHRLAALMHLALYAFLLVMPLLGWLTLSAKGRVSIVWSGVAAVGGSRQGMGTHSGGYPQDYRHRVGYYLIGLHTAAALIHHYFVHDNTLLRMLPARKSTPRSVSVERPSRGA